MIPPRWNCEWSKNTPRADQPSFATSNKCIASSNRCLTSSNKKLLVTKGIDSHVSKICKGQRVDAQQKVKVLCYSNWIAGLRIHSSTGCSSLPSHVKFYACSSPSMLFISPLCFLCHEGSFDERSLLFAVCENAFEH